MQKKLGKTVFATMLIAGVGLSGVASAATAENSPQDFDLDQIIVTAQRYEKRCRCCGID